MKPDWDKLMAEYKGHTSALVGDVDCTAEGKALCDKVGVRGYPTIKYGDPAAFQDYKGGRTLDALKKFAADNLGPKCGPDNIDLCDADTAKLINGFKAMPAADLAAQIKTLDAETAEAEKTFKAETATAQKKIAEAAKAKTAAMDALEKKGFVHMKAVQKAAGKAEL